MCKNAKNVWNSLIITHQGNKQVKDNKIDLFVQKYEEFVISDDETIDCVFARFNIIITSLKALDEYFSSRNHVRKFLRAFPTKWRLKEALKTKKEKCKSLALKAKKVSSDEETSCSSSDDEYAMAVRDFKKFFRRRGKSVRQPHNEKKILRSIKEEKKGKEDESEEEDDSKRDEICLMVLDNNEVRHKVKLERNEWIKDSGCSRHMTGNKDLFSTYEAINGGNVVFGSNTKSKIIGKIVYKRRMFLDPTESRYKGTQLIWLQLLQPELGLGKNPSRSIGASRSLRVVAWLTLSWPLGSRDGS
ncbi:hypothetical protein Tco_0794125 [Tanacetum coccineum]